MAVNNSLIPQKKHEPFTIQIQKANYQNLINTTLRDKNTADRFIVAITSAVSANPVLQKCDPGTVLSAGLLGEGLKLSPSPQLGQYYLVPYDCKEYVYNTDGSHATDENGKWLYNTVKKAQFQIGYKGYIQLAIRSGQYKKLNVIPIKQGELIRFNPFDEEIEVQLIEDENKREKTPTIGYYAMFEYINGFRKAIYWSRDKMESHALKYSAGYKAKKGYTFWEKDFDVMACKTMLRQLISKWGIMSIEMQNAYTNDMAVINENGETEHVDCVDEDNQSETPINEPENIVDIDAAQYDEETLNDDEFAELLGE